eukprot:5575523-Amphidinium_carterae.1
MIRVSPSGQLGGTLPRNLLDNLNGTSMRGTPSTPMSKCQHGNKSCSSNTELYRKAFRTNSKV